jgi:hypothetical protein
VEPAAPEEPTVVEPGADEPGAEEPTVVESGADEPGAEEPTVVESGADEPGAVQPGAEEACAEEACAVEPVVEVGVMVKVPVPWTRLPRCFTVHSWGGSQWVMTMSSVNPMGPTEVRAATPPPTPVPFWLVAQTRVSTIQRDWRSQSITTSQAVCGSRFSSIDASAWHLPSEFITRVDQLGRG